MTNPNRYPRQERLSSWGEDRQRRLQASRVVVIGCGALGSNGAESLARAGVGEIRLVDRDFVEETNLHRQSLYTESDARSRTPKALAAAAHLAEIRSDLRLDPQVRHVDPGNIEELLEGADCVVDGTDNFETRWVLNDACVKRNLPWVYAGCLGYEGVCLTIRPPATPCLRCLFDELPAEPPPTCETAGIWPPAVRLVSALQISEVLKILGGGDHLSGALVRFNLEHFSLRSHPAEGLKRPDCPCCGEGRFEFLSLWNTTRVASLCGRNSVQVLPPPKRRVDLEELAARLPADLNPVRTDAFLRFQEADLTITLFPEGRAILEGTSDLSRALSVYTRLVGG